MANRFPLMTKEIGWKGHGYYPTSPLIYKIVNSENNKIYIGQTLHFRNRLKDHRNLLINNKHFCKYLQNSFNKHGIENFYVEIIEICTKENICEREFYWIEELKSYNHEIGFNILINAPSPWYGKRSIEHCLNISKGLTGNKTSEETKRKQAAIRIAKHRNIIGEVSIAVLQFDKNMNFIKEYETIREASERNKIKSSTLRECLRGKNKTSGGYIWKYKQKGGLKIAE